MSWFDDDPELLRAALEIIESWDGESSVNGMSIASRSPATEETDSTNDEICSEDGSELTSNSAPSPRGAASRATSVAANRAKRQTIAVPLSSTVVAKTGAAPRELKPSTVSSTRHKRREEILYLRGKVTDMETQLATLHKQNVDGDSSGTSAMSGVDAALAVMWQDIAGRQQRLRHKSELEQAKLRGMLETQMKVARGLIKLMQKARRIEEDESFPVAKRPKLPINMSVAATEEAQCAHIDELYQSMDEAFSFDKFHDGTIKFIDVEVVDRGDEEVVIEFRDAWALPFQIAEVMDAMWAYMSKRTEQKGCQEEARTVIHESEDTFITHFTASASVGALKGKFDGKGISRRFPQTEERGHAIITSMFAEPHHTKGDELEGIQFHEDGWLRVLSAQALTGQSDGRVLSVAQSNRRFRLTFDADNTPASRRNAGVLTDFLLDQLTQEIQFKHETVETLLLHLRSQ